MKDVLLLAVKELKYAIAMAGAVGGFWWTLMDPYQFGAACGLILYGRIREIRNGQRGDDHPVRKGKRKS